MISVIQAVQLGHCSRNRLLALVGVDGPDTARVKVAAFRRLLLLIVAVELCDRASRWQAEASFPVHVLLAGVALAGAALAWRPVSALGLVLVSLAAVADFVWQFPESANHQYLQLVCIGQLLLLRTDIDEEVQLLVVSLRWVLVIGVFYAGLQKLLYGYYFDGQFLAFAISGNPRFAAVLQYLMSAGELERIRGLQILEGAGPFRVDSSLFRIVSNAAYLTELILPPLLLMGRTRRLAIVGMLAYFVCIEVAAREVFFGGIVAALALLFAPGDALRRALPIFLTGLACLALTILGLLPRWFFS